MSIRTDPLVLFLVCRASRTEVTADLSPYHHSDIPSIVFSYQLYDNSSGYAISSIAGPRAHFHVVPVACAGSHHPCNYGGVLPEPLDVLYPISHTGTSEHACHYSRS